MKRETWQVRVYEHMIEALEEEMEAREMSKSETIRTILEEKLNIPMEVRKQYRDSVYESRIRGNTSNKRRISRRDAKKKVRKFMKRKQHYTLSEIAQETGYTRQIIKEVVEDRYPLEFEQEKEEGRNAYKIRKRSRAEIDELKGRKNKDQETLNKIQAEFDDFNEKKQDGRLPEDESRADLIRDLKLKYGEDMVSKYMSS